ncbi:hypothetical protein [Pseudobutyrivibrio xylanivorans]|uniref:Mobilization protein n=1 Tax=Pseudobutyrivibrio xylanivorans TaxID=185007 RepID=A0A5P6VLM7_PSEXY|nr:hypothetical protein [Pseudobutyrivibrio xylanivorans]QFJ53390.1 hypothetical protein FXF36_00130 [Pseudobutyrivibrio xylanivorans]QFJ53467.1 hypothetical protein FXF36_00540 [Pseudobutyrivibrio xylanivorans]
MKVTCRNKRAGCLANHNDRNFDIQKADHIDISKSINNIYGNIYEDEGLKFKDVELKYYKEQYGERIKHINETYIKARHKERCMTIEKYYIKHPPEETILQIGTMTDNINPEIFKDCVMEYLKQLEKYNSNCHVLDWAIHVDEKSPHAHIRKCWDYINENGDLAISKENALEKLGISRVDEHLPQGRRNNRTVAFDTMMREKWTEIVEARGFTIERKTERELNPEREDMDIHQFKEQKLKENLEIIREYQVKVQELENKITEQDSQKREIETRAEAERIEKEREFQNTVVQLNQLIIEQQKQIKMLEQEIQRNKHKSKDEEIEL